MHNLTKKKNYSGQRRETHSNTSFGAQEEFCWPDALPDATVARVWVTAALTPVHRVEMYQLHINSIFISSSNIQRHPATKQLSNKYRSENNLPSPEVTGNNFK